MARAEMRTRVSIFFDPPELDFRVAPRACGPNVSMTAAALRTTFSPETGVAACSLAAWPVSGISLGTGEGTLLIVAGRQRPGGGIERSGSLGFAGRRRG